VNTNVNHTVNTYLHLPPKEIPLRCQLVILDTIKT
jgi:hypothetical protein